MQLTIVSGGPIHCHPRTCPTIYKTDRGTIVVQGTSVTDDCGIEVPADEALVEIPVALLATLPDLSS